MGAVTDVFWACPGCKSRERAQVVGWGREIEFRADALPGVHWLKWNPPCSRCGKFRLAMKMVVARCEEVDESED